MQTPPRILIIDDDPMIRLLVATSLQNAGLETQEAANAEEGLQYFNESGADAILLDVVMPGIDGYACCKEIRNLPKGQYVPILMMTGLEDLESINRAFEVGATDFITKPINSPLLGHRVRYMLRASHTTHRLLESERHLHRMAYIDSLTELPNRLYFKENLKRVVALAERQNRKLAVLFLDLDGFKRINDTLGHHLGDQVLQATSDRLRKGLRTSDMSRRTNILDKGISVARLGGDEFTVLLASINRTEDAASVAERIRLNLAKPFIYGDNELYTTTSIGIAIYPDDGETCDELLQNADLAMYHAKRGGGNRYRYFSNKMTETALRRLTLENNLRKAIERGELELWYQPVLNLEDGTFNGVEALLRWNSHELGKIAPDEFIPLAEELGLILEIGDWVLRQACKQGVAWINQGIPLKRLAVNVSGIQFLHRDFTALVPTILAETGLEPSILELEVTESALISDENSVLEALLDLKQNGLQLAIDDFGVGYSSLSRLKKFPIDRLKIDKSFISGLEDDPDNVAITTAIIALAKGMSMTVTAEGVETEAQLQFLKDLNCDEVQGYLLSLPLPASQIETFFMEKSTTV